jgi:hypothetical protein
MTAITPWSAYVKESNDYLAKTIREDYAKAGEQIKQAEDNYTKKGKTLESGINRSLYDGQIQIGIMKIQTAIREAKYDPKQAPLISKLVKEGLADLKKWDETFWSNRQRSIEFHQTATAEFNKIHAAIAQPLAKLSTKGRLTEQEEKTNFLLKGTTTSLGTVAGFVVGAGTSTINTIKVQVATQAVAEHSTRMTGKAIVKTAACTILGGGVGYLIGEAFSAKPLE